jgi:exonuclease RecJ (EC 3.1.-.-)
MVDALEDFSADLPLSVLGKRWQVREANDRTVLFYQQKYSLPAIVARLLVARGIQEPELESFLNPSLKALMPDPSHLKDMDKAITRLVAALQGRQKIAVFGDYDVDGATSSALLKRYFQMLGHDITVYIPDRIKEGYGPNSAALSKLKASGHDLVITVDCGTASFEALDYAQTLGLDVIVIDHHIAELKLPPAYAIINPNRFDQDSPLKHCAAAGVVFVTLVALNAALRAINFPHPLPDLLTLLDLVATGTVCDVVPLTGLNRAFVRQGLKIFAKRQNKGLKALADVAGIDAEPSAYHLGFLIGPRINAGGRVGEASLGARVLATHDEAEARQIATQLSIFNEERQAIEATVLAEAMAQAEPQEGPILVVHSQGWHPGVIGIVAGRLKDKFYKPTLVISFQEQIDEGQADPQTTTLGEGQILGKGSGRSIEGLDLGSLIQRAKHQGLLVNGGGHMMAAGLTIALEHLEAFKAFLIEQVTAMRLDLTPALKLDGFLTASGVTVALGESLEALAPFGQGHPGPRFLFDGLCVLKADVVGKNHVRCVFSDFGGQGRLNGIAFRALETPLGDLLLQAAQSHQHKAVQIAGTLKLDEWQGQRKVQIFIDDAREIPFRAKANPCNDQVA